MVQCLSVKHYSDSNPEIVLCAVKQSGRVVVNLDNADVNSIARANVDTASECGCPSGLFLREISRTWRRRDGDANIVADVHAIASMCGSEEPVNERFEGRFRRVVFDLNASEEVIETRIDVDSVLNRGERNGPALEVARQIKL